MDIYSIMLENQDTDATSANDLNQRVAQRIRELRAARDLSMDMLAAQSSVSRSMISLIERGECSATAVVLEKLATALGATLSSLFEAPHASPAFAPVLRRGDQITWRDPHSGYVRTQVSPAGCHDAAGVAVRASVQIVDVMFPPQARVAYETAAREPRIYEHVWVLSGRIDVSIGDEQYELCEGDCLALMLDRPSSFHNPTQHPARYAVVIATLPNTET
jgi:transcriptional regulator with XRE-family HTH domain